MKVYVADPDREFDELDADELENRLEEESGKELVKTVLAWKGRMTTDYAATHLKIDPVEAQEILEELDEDEYCYPVYIDSHQNCNNRH